MATKHPAFRPLNAQMGWLTAVANSVVADKTLSLAAAAAGSLSLASAPDTLGGLILPRHLALAPDGTLYLLLVDEAIVKQASVPVGFQPLRGIGGQGSNPRQFQQAQSIACTSSRLYVGDNGRLQCFDRQTLSLIQVVHLPDGGQPSDIAVYQNIVYILDGQNGRLYHNRSGRDQLTHMARIPERVWQRLGIDRNGRLYLLNDANKLHIFDRKGRFIDEVADAGQVRDQFDLPPVRQLVQDGVPLLWLNHDLQAATPLQPRWFENGRFFTQAGEPIQLAANAFQEPQLYSRRGLWISKAIDSSLYQCQWHKLVLKLGKLPSGTQLTIHTYADATNDKGAVVANHFRQLQAERVQASQTTKQRGKAAGVFDQRQHLKDTCHIITGPRSAEPVEVLVQSRPGRYLWIGLEFRGDGFGSPIVEAVEAHYPRNSYLEYLPAIFSADDESRWFLERFLSIFQAEWDGIEQEIQTISRYFDPRTVPEGAALHFLAGWLALPLEKAWSGKQQRRLLAATPEIYARRGSSDSLRHYLQIYLQNMIDLTPQQQGAFPQVVEGFRERRFWRSDALRLGEGRPLWGANIIGRFQFGVFTREGEAKLVAHGEPDSDIFYNSAHRFRVFVPSAWVPTQEAETMLRRALDDEKPAHTTYELHLVEANFRIGVQSTIGFDTVIGDYRLLRLAWKDAAQAPARRFPQQRLGYDTILDHGAHPNDGWQLLPDQQMGFNTVLR